MAGARLSKVVAVGRHRKLTSRTCRRRKRWRHRLSLIIRDRRRLSGRRRGRICGPLAWRFAIGRRLRGNVSLTEKIGKKRLVGIASEEARKFAAQPVAEAFRELRIASVFQSMQHESPEQNFSPCVISALLFSGASLQGLLLCIELGDSFGNAFASHWRAPLSAMRGAALFVRCWPTPWR